MVELVAKRYVKALMAGRDGNAISAICEELKTIAPAFGDNKFNSILNSTDINSNQKVDLVLSFVENPSKDVTNLIKLLGEKKRLDIIPDVVDGLESELSVLNNSFTGVVYTNKKLSSQDMDKLTSQFSAKFNVTLELAQNVCDYDGIKVDIDGLGVEIGFSKERLKSQMIDHILKAV